MGQAWGAGAAAGEVQRFAGSCAVGFEIAGYGGIVSGKQIENRQAPRNDTGAGVIAGTTQ